MLSQSAVPFKHGMHIMSNRMSTVAAARRMPDPFILNSRGNAHASLGQWQGVLEDPHASLPTYRCY